MPSKQAFIEVMVKHLPPSASELNLLDIGGVVSDELQALRPDLRVQVASLNPHDWSYAPDTIDAVTAYDMLLRPEILAQVLRVMRPGGRFIVVNPLGEVHQRFVNILEDAGYIRILVEPAVDDTGVLIRGEKAHTTADTLQRVQAVAMSDSDMLDLTRFPGRFVHLLILQRPNIPAWKLTPADRITWQAVAVLHNGKPHLLAFSSLPKAVSFMQPAVIDGFVTDINKVGKFTREIAGQWQVPVLLNPTLESVRQSEVYWLDIDPATAEAPDE